MLPEARLGCICHTRIPASSRRHRLSLGVPSRAGLREPYSPGTESTDSGRDSTWSTRLLRLKQGVGRPAGEGMGTAFVNSPAAAGRNIFGTSCMEVMMRAFAVGSFGEPASVHDLPVPTADGEVLIRVRFAGVNPLDNNLLGRLTAASSYPFVVGIDFAGVAERVPAGARRPAGR